MKTKVLKKDNTIKIQKNVSLADKNWFKTGGNARFFCDPKNQKEFKEAISFAQKHILETFVFGSGANLLVNDDGFKGFAICPKMKNISFSKMEGDTWCVTAETGVLIDDLIEKCLENGLVGLEPFSGIPGTIGGAVFINLHYFGSRIEHNFVHGTVLDKNSGKTSIIDKKSFNFGYNHSTLHCKNKYLLDATFTVKKVSELEIAYTSGRRDEIIRQRQSRYPTERTCGSFFRNFSQEELKRGNKKAIHPYIAYYLDKVGVKGSLRCNGAVVSHKHANMIITDRDNATSSDIIRLALKMQEIIHQEFNLVPQLECQLLGFEKYPLKK
ncbi:UDP-N-acetylmuramate dehydrogenase [Candidatus Dependentiae bacterium]